MSKLSVRNVYFTPVKKRTSIGDSSRSRPKNKNTRKVSKHKHNHTDQFNKHVSYKSKIDMLKNLFSLLELKDKLPVIVFAFSRKGCENYCNQLENIDYLKHKSDKSFA